MQLNNNGLVRRNSYVYDFIIQNAEGIPGQVTARATETGSVICMDLIAILKASMRFPKKRVQGRRTHSNPCKCKVVGPAVGFAAFVVAGIVEWPVGALVYVFRHMKGRRIMAHPATVVYPRVSKAFPI
ncbi:hypothetical protein HHK36_006809 [Tetracentron sinense]|uniref:Uncharacterized protein n=1 Tax=Tetracentron sinense TaxID=13715 RepID=A0A835DPF8_TETSI|nr:hypothetical protein HHK36_006809 [Tetracentron sinense]